MSKSFTLIELLVVISVISILTAILLSSLVNTKKLADKAVCENMKRQLIIYYYSDGWETDEASPSYTSQFLVRNYPDIKKSCYDCHASTP